MLLRRVQSANAAPVNRSSVSLAETGLIVYQKALKEHLPLAHIAEQSGRPQYWFAAHIIQIVGVHGKAPGTTTFVRVTREMTGGLRLDDEMTALCTEGEALPRYADLRSDKADIDRYLDWARTVY